MHIASVIPVTHESGVVNPGSIAEIPGASKNVDVQVPPPPKNYQIKTSEGEVDPHIESDAQIPRSGALRKRTPLGKEC